jgi:hypothetical protein
MRGRRWMQCAGNEHGMDLLWTSGARSGIRPGDVAAPGIGIKTEGDEYAMV